MNGVRKVAIVTGGNRGIGAAIVERLASDGMHVAILSEQPPQSYQEFFERLQNRGADVSANICDISDRGAVDHTVAAIADEMGGLDVCVNNAGVALPDPMGIADPASFDRMVAVNIVGTYNMMRAAIDVMNRSGSIVNIASSSGVLGVHGMVGYSATKAAIISMTKTLPGEIRGRGIRVNAIAPAGVATELTAGLVNPQTDAERRVRAHVERITPSPDGEVVLSAERVADMVAFLISPAAVGMTGSVMMADFGLSSSVELFPAG